MTYYNQFLTYQDRQYIFQNLTLSPDLKAEHTALDSFYTATVNTNIGLIESIALRIDTIQTWTYYVAALDSSEADTIYTVDSTAKAARAAYVDATLTINSGIVPAFVIETNHKTLNNLQLNFLKLLTDTLTETETNDLKAIARQCPTKGGQPVYDARSWLITLGNTLLENVDSCSYFQITVPDSIDERRAADFAASQDFSLKVYPNPARGQITVSYELEEGQSAKLNLNALDGRTLRSIALDSDATEIQIPLEGLPAGLYLLEMKTATGVRSVVKFVVAE